MDKSSGKGHKLIMDDREKLSITGVKKVQSFDSKEIVLETIQGVLSLKGDQLGIKHLDLQEGLTEVEGHIDAIIYPRQASGSRQSMLGRIFK